MILTMNRILYLWDSANSESYWAFSYDMFGSLKVVKWMNNKSCLLFM